jgi:multidrug resistance efflux pump
MIFTIDRSRLANLVAQSDAARLATAGANDRLRVARADLRNAEANQAEAVRVGQKQRAEELEPFIAKARDAFAAANAEHDRLSKLSRAAGAIARNCVDHAETAGIRL